MKELHLFALGFDDFFLRDEWASLRVIPNSKLEADLDLRVLDVAEHYGLKSTIFISGSTAQRFPDLPREIVERGLEIGGHGLVHEDLRLLRSTDRVRETISSTLTILGRSTQRTVEGWKSPGLFQDRLVREGLARSEVKWCTGTMIPLAVASLGCELLPFYDYDSKVELPTAPELVDYDLYVRRGVSSNGFRKAWTRILTRFGSSVLIFTVHPWLQLLENHRFKALGRVFECLASSGKCSLEGEIYQMFRDGRITVGSLHQSALRLASRIFENARNRVTARPR